MTKSSSIGVFDSGLGGLHLLGNLRKILPAEDFIYLGDTARVPYGAKSPENIAHCSQQNVEFLQNQGAKAIVIACNSASSVSFKLESKVPLFGVIEPSAQEACSRTHSGRIGVVGTRATLNQNTYVDSIKRIRPQFEVFQQACPLLVPLAEEAWDNDPITNLVVYRYLTPLLEKEIDTLVLGCTHYPILRSSFEKVVGPNVNIVDSSAVGAYSAAQNMKEQGLLENNNRVGKLRLLTTDHSPYQEAMAARFLNEPRPSPIELVHL